MSGEPVRGESGNAILAALFLILLVELAVIGAVRQIQSAGIAARQELGWSAADRLADSGLVHARVLLTRGESESEIAGELAEGVYGISLVADSRGQRAVVTGVARSGHKTTIEAVWTGSDLVSVVRTHGR